MVGAVVVGLGSCAFTLPLPDDVRPARETAAAAAPLGVPVTESPRPAVEPGDARSEAATPSSSSATASPPAPALETFTGSASYYADKFEGRRTASGVRFRQSEMWAAHRTLPFGTRLRVTNLANGREVEVEVVDRGPFIRGRVVDLSRAAARQLDYIRAGHTPVKVEVIARP